MFMRILSLVFALFVLSSISHAQFDRGTGGNYGGLLESSADPDDSGILTVVLRDSGASTIKLFWQGQVYSFAQRFDADGNLVRQIKKKGVTDDSVMDLVCVLNPSGRRIGGILTDDTATSSSSFSLNGDQPQPDIIEPGMRVSFIEPTSTDPIKEDGFTVVTVGKTSKRATRFVGNLPDGTPYSAGSVLRGTEYALRAGLYAQKKPGSGGQLLGLGEVDASAASEAHAPRGGVAQLLAAFRWHKKRNLARNTAYPDGIDQRLNVNARGYSRGRDLSLVLTGQSGPRNATLRMTNGNLGTRADGGTPGPNPLTVGVNVTIFGAKIVSDNPHKVKLAVNPLTARFNGSFRHPDTNEVMKFRGAFSSFDGVNPGSGRGNFLSRGPVVRGVPADPANARSGSVRIETN